MAVRDSELAPGRTADAPTLEYADTTSVAARLSGQRRRGWWLLAILILLGAVGAAMVIK